MRNILHNVVICLFFFFLVNIVEAGIRWTPPTEYLPPERLDMLLQKWDQLAHSDDLWDRDGALALVLGIIPRGERFSGAFFCAYDNPVLSYFEIHPLANAHIDHFAKTCLHEDRHRLDIQDMWPNAYPETLAARLTWDRDLDYVKNNYESIWGFDPDDPDSDNDGHIDFEDRGFNAELAWTNGSANSEDWAVGGAQW